MRTSSDRPTRSAGQKKNTHTQTESPTIPTFTEWHSSCIDSNPKRWKRRQTHTQMSLTAMRSAWGQPCRRVLSPCCVFVCVRMCTNSYYLRLHRLRNASGFDAAANPHRKRRPKWQLVLALILQSPSANLRIYSSIYVWGFFLLFVSPVAIKTDKFPHELQRNRSNYSRADIIPVAQVIIRQCHNFHNHFGRFASGRAASFYDQYK